MTKDLTNRMQKTLEALQTNLNKIRTGRAHPSILDAVLVDYYGSEVPLNQVANINIEDARTLSIVPWEKTMVQPIEKAILKSDLGLNPSTAGANIRVPMPALTEETRKNYVRQAKQEAENARMALRNIRRDDINDLKQALKDKEISEDDERRQADEVQKVTDKYTAKVDELLAAKETDLLEI